MTYKTATPNSYGMLKAYARENRKNATLAEDVLWERLRNNRLGMPFLRQHIIGDYIVDFVSRHDGLIIEVDGDYHSEPRQQQNDRQREEDLKQMGYHIIRFTNEEVLFETDKVTETIINYFK